MRSRSEAAGVGSTIANKPLLHNLESCSRYQHYLQVHSYLSKVEEMDVHRVAGLCAHKEPYIDG